MSVFIGDKTKRVELAERKDATNPNLFSNTDEMNNFWQPFTGENGSVEPSANYASDTNHELIATKSVFKADGATADVSAMVTTQQIYFESGAYTISFLARNNGTDKTSFPIELYSDYTDSNGGSPLGSTSTNLTNVWQQYSITFKIAKAGTYGSWRLLHNNKVDLPGGSLYFANLKLEKGAVATPWCPALEDYAWTSDITTLQNTVNNIDSTRTPIVTGASGDDLFAFKTNQIRLYNGNGAKCKNLPSTSNTHYFTVQYIFEGPNDGGIAIYRSPANEIWTIGCNAGYYNTGWIRVANATDITNLQNTIQANKTDVTNLANRVTALEQNSLKIVPITQADYDALSTKDPNTIYAIGG